MPDTQSSNSRCVKFESTWGMPDMNPMGTRLVEWSLFSLSSRLGPASDFELSSDVSGKRRFGIYNNGIWF